MVCRSVMKSCSPAVCVLILLTTTFATVCASNYTDETVKVKLHGSATLPCNRTCPGLVKWIVKHDAFHVLALCNHTSCQSKEGFLISHHRYLMGDFSLNITDVNSRKVTTYTCQCDAKDICTVKVQILSPSVKVKCHESATLPCNQNCSGLARWTTDKESNVLTECNQTSCLSVKEGYQMIHDQYLKGDLSLIIPDADFKKRDFYTCDCDGIDIDDVHLQIEPLLTAVQMKPNESLVLHLDIPEVEVIYNNADSANAFSGQICTVDGCSLQCKGEYEPRVSPALELRGMKLSDSGIYTIRDPSDEDDVIHVYTVTVKDDQPQPAGDKESLRGLVIASLVLLVVILLMFVALFVYICHLRTENLRLRTVHERDSGLAN